MSEHHPEQVMALVTRVLNGETQAYEELVTPLEGDLRAFLRGQLRGRSDIDVEEVLQDVRIYLYRRLDRYNPEYPLGVFARGLARNVARRFRYKKSDLAFVPDSDDDDWDNELSPGDLDKPRFRFRQVLGEGRFEDPGGPPPPSRAFLEMLEIFFRDGGYPHQQAAFGYSILLWGKAKQDMSRAVSSEKVPVTGDPDRVVREVGPEVLDAACGGMVAELQEDLHLEPGYLERIRRPMDFRLDLRGRDLFAKDRTSAIHFEALADHVAGTLELAKYFGKDDRKSVADWTRGVKERIKKVVADPESRKRIPLPEPPGL